MAPVELYEDGFSIEILQVMPSRARLNRSEPWRRLLERFWVGT